MFIAVVTTSTSLDMGDLDSLPGTGPVKEVQRSLHPFVKKRQEVIKIRRILTFRLTSHINSDEDEARSIARPLSLLETSCGFETIPHGFRGIQKEYLRCVLANINARTENAAIRREHLGAHAGYENQDSVSRRQGSSKDLNAACPPIQSFLDLVTQRQKHDRLHIVQDYIDMLAEKSAASPEHLDPKRVLKDVESLPKMPPEIMQVSNISQGSGRTDLKGLVDQLEKSVLCAKLLLKREQNFLAKLKAENEASSNSNGSRLEALGHTRNFLINWIEDELAGAGENLPESEGIQDLHTSGSKGKAYIDAQLIAVQNQYARYTKARQSLVAVSTDKLDTAVAPSHKDSVISPPKDERNGLSAMSQVIHPYLEEMVTVTNEQKAIIQQKSHLTITLAKQLKEAGQGLGRMADESHLLPTHPLPTVSSQHKGLEAAVSFGDEISSHEKPDTSRRAQAWVFAAEAAGNATKGLISDRLEEGEVLIADAQQTLLEVHNLLGNQNKVTDLGRGLAASSKRENGQSGDIWARLDGNLGVNKDEREGHDVA
jgi:hypothetical protein